ncbi:MAG: TMEM175 family protein [Dehalococcoidia bacterium]|nr:TMEM175 family protein [Dehalococcoidia bacterium]
MTKNRLEAFSDGVIAILITIMVLELHVPEDDSLEALRPLLPVLASYAMSFVFVGVYWNNHHHLLQAVDRVNGRVLWANLHLLFWLSLVPFTTAWMGENEFTRWPVAAYGLDLWMCAVAFTILVVHLRHLHGPESVLDAAIGNDIKGKISLALYTAAIPTALVFPWVSVAVYVLVTVIWWVPDRRIERALAPLAPGDA